jgi:DNA-binding transcriptional LysR family regulator
MRVELAAYGFGVTVASESYLVQSARGRVGIVKPRSGEPLRYSWVLASATRGARTRASTALLQFTNAQLETWVQEGAVLTREGWDIAG